MTKRELVIQVASKLGLTQNEVSTIIQETLETISDVMVEGKRLEIRNFGVFEVKVRDARIGRNPRTGEEVPISRKRVASFRPGKALKEWVQLGPDHRPDHLFRSDGGVHTASAPAPSTDGPEADATSISTPSPSGDQESRI